MNAIHIDLPAISELPMPIEGYRPNFSSEHALSGYPLEISWQLGKRGLLPGGVPDCKLVGIVFFYIHFHLLDEETFTGGRSFDKFRSLREGTAK